MPWTKNDPRKINLLHLSVIFLVLVIDKGVSQGLSSEEYKTSDELPSEEEFLPAQKLPSPGLSALEKIKDLETELKSVKKHCDDRLNQLENRFTNLEDRLYEPKYPNDPNYPNDYERPLY